MKRLICNFEAFLLLKTTTRKKTFGLLFLSLLLPGHLKYLFVFILISKLLPLDVNSRRIKMILSLPFSRIEIFLFSFIIGFVIIFSATVIGESFFIGKADFAVFPNLFVFYSAYFGILMLVTTKGADNLTFPVFLLITDLIAGSIGTPETNVYQLISPLYQKNFLLSSLISFFILSVSFVVFVVDRREKW
jgi:uncharacterized membrane protein YjgN (DUF898 family)